MFIECPACHTRAKIPDQKEGAKVRCSNCERVYVAKAPGASGSRTKGDPTRYVIFGAGVLLLAFVMYKVNASRAPKAVTVATEVVEEKPAPVDSTGWNSLLVKQARELHELAFVCNVGRLRDLLDGEKVYQRWHAPAAETAGGDATSSEAPQETQLAVAGEGGAVGNSEAVTVATPPLQAAADVPLWFDLRGDEQMLFLSEVTDRMTKGDEKELLVDWVPYAGAGEGGDGVISETDEEAIVRMVIKNRQDATLTDRHVEWKFIKRKGQWKAYEWRRWFSPEELAGERAAKSKKTVKRTLSDGSFVVEGEIRPLEHLEDTPAELRTEIDALVVKLVDLNTPAKELTATRKRLEEIGRPAVPTLLSQLAIIPLETQDQAIQLNLACDMLYRITGHVTTFKPDEALGATLERRESGLKQWFGWYDSKFKRFTEKAVGEDTLTPINEKERQMLEDLKQQKEFEERFGTGQKKD